MGCLIFQALYNTGEFIFELGVGTSMRRSSWSAFGRLTCWQCRSGHYFHQSFFIFFSPSSLFLIEGVLGSKNLFSESC